jgi:hypothetical protein
MTKDGPVFEASVDSRLPSASTYVGGTRLSDLRWIALSINVNAAPNPQYGSNLMTGYLRLQKLNGEVSQKLVTCTRQ